MPTGYTADIAKGITFEQYIWSCARAFGALVMMREERSDAPIPQRFEPSDYNANKLAALRAERERIVSMTNVQADEEATRLYADAKRVHEERVQAKRDLRAAYLTMRARASAWEPPSEDHRGLKDFMVEQIDLSIDGDCSEKYMTVPSLLTGSEWRHERLTQIDHDIQYHHDENAKEVARTETRNVWLLALRASVPPPVVP